MSLLDRHEEYLGINLEDENRFGVPLRFLNPEETIDETINGLFSSASVNVITSDGANVNSKSTRCSVRRSTVLAIIGEIPTEGWRVYNGSDVYIIQKQTKRPDDRLPLISYPLVVLKEV